MCFGKIVDMNVVANAGAVGSWIVTAKNIQRWSGACSSTKRQRNKMRFRVVRLADSACLVRSCCVEVTKTGITQVVGPIVSFERVLAEKLRRAIRVHRL